MRFLQDNWGEIIWYGLILFWVSSCVKGNIDERASKRAIKEQKRIENKIEEERMRHEAYRETQVNTFNMFKEDVLTREMLQRERN